jgi:hypothetical protein
VEAMSGSAYLRQNNTNGHLYLYTFYSHKIFGKNPFFTRPVSCTQSKTTRRLVTRTKTKKGTDCTRIQQDVRTAHPNIRVSVRKTAYKRYCAIPDNTLLSTNFALHKSPKAKQEDLFF